MLSEISNILQTKLAQRVIALESASIDAEILSWATIKTDTVNKFIIETKCYIGEIPIDSIVGQWEHYAGQTWKDALLTPSYNSAKMLKNIKDYEANPLYYESERPDLCFYSIDGKNWFTDTGNNHRCVIIKALYSLGDIVSLKGVLLTRYIVDEKALSYYQLLTSIEKSYTNMPIILVDKDDNSNLLSFIVSDSLLSQKPTRLTRNEFIAYAEWNAHNQGIKHYFKWLVYFNLLWNEHPIKPFSR